MRTIASFFVLALSVAASPVSTEHSHDDGLTLATRADGTKVAVVTCMDPRINVDFLLKQLKLSSSTSYIIRNAGGRAKEALRSVMVSQEFLGTSEVYVIHHTDCGMADKSEEGMRRALYKKDDLARTFMVNQMDFLPIRTKNYTESVLDDIALVTHHPLLKSNAKVSGYIYNIGANGARDSVKQVYP
ncbi:carbonic anhydrase [Rhizoctonia solani AG-1 IB]|uniref:Carbonic anhydrase n=1 Tax=Thanatephorus cucumeris (strain AG1-IB / isolate 7/3/14) TaxID=1108050 RepID=M5BU43_THACB|nr:carbonic anhydrase [Rhizoctonia solani AG-1 IB]